MLYNQRRIVDVVACPASGLAGQDLDIAPILADDSGSGESGPTFLADFATMSHWAMLVCGSWLLVPHLQRMVTHAKVVLTQVVVLWQAAKGPVTAFVATATRLGVRSGMPVVVGRMRVGSSICPLITLLLLLRLR